MKRILNFLRLLQGASGDRGIAGQCLDLLLLKLRLNVAPKDYYMYEFYKHDRTPEQISTYASNRGSRYWIYENNPFKYQILFTDKYVQKNLLIGLRLPTPRFLALVGAGGSVSSPEALQTVIDRAPAEFILKPVSSRGGYGIHKLTKSDGVLLEGNQPVAVDKLWHSLEPYLQRGIVIEETVQNCEVIGRMNPSSLNTFRVITFRFPGAGWVPISSYLKVGRSQSVVDNSGAGGLVVRINDDGVTGLAVDFETRTELSNHPDSGAALAGQRIDGFKDVVDLAVTGSAHFSQMGILGWDIALTDNGPMIIEVNASPACEYPQVAYGGLVTAAMANVLAPRHIFSRYDKRYMYPNHYIDRRGRV